MIGLDKIQTHWFGWERIGSVLFLAKFFLNGHVVIQSGRQNKSDNKFQDIRTSRHRWLNHSCITAFQIYFVVDISSPFWHPAMCCTHMYFARTACYQFDPFPVRFVDGCYKVHANPIRWAWWGKKSYKCCRRVETYTHQRSIIASTDAAAPILVSMEGYVRRFVTLTAPGLTVPVLTHTLVSGVRRRWNIREAAKT